MPEGNGHKKAAGKTIAHGKRQKPIMKTNSTLCKIHNFPRQETETHNENKPYRFRKHSTPHLHP